LGHQGVELGGVFDLGPVAAAAEDVQARVRQELEQPPARRQGHHLIVAAVDDEVGAATWRIAASSVARSSMCCCSGAGNIASNASWKPGSTLAW